jgi:NitT/TauT family transport system ATP-binding protein
VTLADRILVLGATPGHIRIELAGLPAHERAHHGPARQHLVDAIYRVMTNPTEDASTLVGRPSVPARPERPRRYQVLPDVGIDDLTGFVQYLSTMGGRANVHDLARDLQLRSDDVLAIVEASDLLGFADLQDRAVVITQPGIEFADADLDVEKAMFRRYALAHVSLLRHIVRELDASPSATLDSDRLMEELEEAFSGGEARRQFETVVDWGRYAELFSYDDASGELRLDPETGVGAAEALREAMTGGAAGWLAETDEA